MTHRAQPPTPQTSLGDFETIFARHATTIYRFCLRLCRNPSDAEDLAQEVFVAAFTGRERFEGRAALTTYLYRIAVFRWRTMREKREKSERTGSRPGGLDGAAAPSAPDFARSADERMDLDAALQTLDDRHREAFLLIKAEGMTCREAAIVLGIPEGTVKYHVYNAIRHLQAALAKGDVPSSFAPDRGDARWVATSAVKQPPQRTSGKNCHEL